MNKKYLSIAYLLILTIGTILSIYMPKVESAAKTEETVIIPKEAIRLRILANSDKKADQDVKRLIRDEVNQNITGWVEDLTSLKEAKKVIKSHLPDIQQTAEKIVDEQGIDQKVKVNFGKAEFPTKLYGQYLYPAGEYEAIVITLGKGEGANWWCVLFPPLCFLDFSNGTAVSKSPYEEENTNEIHSEQQNGEKKNAIKEDEAKVKTVKSKKNSEPVIVSNAKQAELESERILERNSEKEKQIYVSRDESPVVVKSFVAELFSEIF
ncbi:stage II sporulation protein R [Peribacillus cavernae]|uniref:Stage II sporulation protein R n=1 Tax=Peribacillus cavernae TaxID=1674310 RepID=A0A3S0UH33_9BACI|nr:stage II sporulation protein R [Peribacillus cavernae]MDQ0218521.1 stage II sporulation protein R [Peribacillus cavernae]RUQ31512.1 stage II sporulation protein R [Peribacillus cavernae]